MNGFECTILSGRNITGTTYCVILSVLTVQSRQIYKDRKYIANLELEVEGDRESRGHVWRAWGFFLQ
jgi:hypothetical protein